MKDSRVGAFGAIAVTLVLLAKVSLLALVGDVDPIVMVVGIFAAHVVSRTFPLLLIRLLPHVGDTAQSKSKPLADQISLAALAVALAWCLSALALVVYAQAAMLLRANRRSISGIFVVISIVTVSAITTTRCRVLPTDYWPIVSHVHVDYPKLQ